MSDACAAVQEVVVIAPGQDFAVPEPGTSVTFSAAVVEGAPEVPEITVARSESLQIGVLIGEPGSPDAEMYGSQDVVE